MYTSLCLLGCYGLYHTLCSHFKKPDFHKNHIQQKTVSKTQFIDLGLPSGTLWADRNIGADAPEQVGDCFRFGETVPFTEDSPQYIYEDIEENIAGTTKDAASVILGKGYKIPTLEQIKELILLCSWEWTELNGAKGMKVTGPNRNSIFFPASGTQILRGWLFITEIYCYMSASANRGMNFHALVFSSDRCSCGENPREWGYPVRAVAVKNMK